MIDEKVLIERLEGESYLTTNDDGETDKFSVQVVEWKDIKKIVKDLASEHNNGWIEKLLEAKKNCGEDSDCSECPFGQIEDRCVLTELQIEKENGWIPCSERLPEKKKEVLIFADDNAIFVGHLMNGGFIVHDGDGWIDLKFILAWQPLPPAPYKKGE